MAVRNFKNRRTATPERWLKPCDRGIASRLDELFDSLIVHSDWGPPGSRPKPGPRGD